MIGGPSLVLVKSGAPPCPIVPGQQNSDGGSWREHRQGEILPLQFRFQGGLGAPILMHLVFGSPYVVVLIGLDVPSRRLI